MADAFDLEAAALAKEAEGTPFSFTYKGEEYTVPPQSSWPVTAISDMAEGRLREALPVLLGEDNARRLLDAGLTVTAMEILFEQTGTALVGTSDLPNSRPPARRGSPRR
jgi:hypothetical protein